jgi:hypothetical protein
VTSGEALTDERAKGGFVQVGEARPQASDEEVSRHLGELEGLRQALLRAHACESTQVLGVFGSSLPLLHATLGSSPLGRQNHVTRAVPGEVLVLGVL